MHFTATIGVEIFFAISGFLIGKIVYRLIQKEDFSFQDVREFWKRRWFRTLPNYYLVLLINILLWYLIYGKIPERIGLYFVYLQNFFSHSPDFSRISWSLSVEQFCYIIGPVLLYLFSSIFLINRLLYIHSSIRVACTCVVPDGCWYFPSSKGTCNH